MTTIRLAHTCPVNPPGTDGPILTEAQVFRGFQRKIRRPFDFVPAIAKAEVLSDDPTTGVVKRRVTFEASAAAGGQPAKEVVEVCTELPPHRVDYEVDDGSSVLNIISGGGGGGGDYDTPENLYVTYVFAWKHPELVGDDAQPTSDAYRAAEEEHKIVAQLAVESSIATTRKLVARGEI